MVRALLLAAAIPPTLFNPVPWFFAMVQLVIEAVESSTAIPPAYDPELPLTVELLISRAAPLKTSMPPDHACDPWFPELPEMVE